MNKKTSACFTFISIIIFLILSILIKIDSNFAKIIRAILGSAYVLFMPGYTYSYLFFHKSDLSFLERLFTSLILSLASTGFVAYYISFANFEINPQNINILILALILIGNILNFIFYRKTHLFCNNKK